MGILQSFSLKHGSEVINVILERKKTKHPAATSNPSPSISRDNNFFYRTKQVLFCSTTVKSIGVSLAHIRHLLSKCRLGHTDLVVFFLSYKCLVVGAVNTPPESTEPGIRGNRETPTSRANASGLCISALISCIGLSGVSEPKPFSMSDVEMFLMIGKFKASLGY